MTCYAMTAVAVTTVLAMPCIWMLGVPVAAASAIISLYLMVNYRSRTGVTVCLVASILVLLVGLTRANEVNKILRDTDRDERDERRR